MKNCHICGAKGFRRLSAHLAGAHGIYSTSRTAVANRKQRAAPTPAWGTEQPQKTGPLHTFTRDEILAARAADAGVTTHTGRVVVVRKQLGERSS